MNETQGSRSAEREDPERPRKHYEKPGIVWEESIEETVGLALACARAALHDPQCSMGGIRS